MSKKFVITIASPVYKNNKTQKKANYKPVGESIAGIMAMDIFITDIVTKVNSLSSVKNSSAYLLDSSGLYIASTGEIAEKNLLRMNISSTDDFNYFTEFVKKQKDGSVIFKSKQVSEYLIFSSIGVSDWALLYKLPFSEVNAPLKKLAWLFILGSFVGLLLLSFTIVVISNLIARPVLSLASGADDIADGDYDHAVEVSSRDEIGYLTYSFNEMAIGLKDREFIKDTFGRYVSKDVMKDILSGNIELGGENKTLTILISDIRKFTAISEKMDPQELVSLLNRYFHSMDTTITKWGGSINKYMGDGILAIFGAPNKIVGHAHNAVCSAIEMEEQLHQLVSELGIKLKIGIGIHTGEVVIGNIGSRNRTEYTVIGDSVNLASRIESLTKIYGHTVLLSLETADLLSGDFVIRMLDKVRVKGKSKPVYLVSPYKKSDTSKTDLAYIRKTNSIMKVYYKGDFQKAYDMITELLMKNKSRRDVHLFLIRRRCKIFIASPPKNQDGVFTYTVK